MIIAIGLGLIGLLLIYFEFFVPGGILGVVGGIVILVSISLFAWENIPIYWIFLYILALILLIIITVRLALWVLKKQPSMYADDDQSGYVASEYDEKLIGIVGTALTDLKPAGYIEVEGCQYQAISESIYVKKGESVKITSGEGSRYKVRIIS